MKKTIRNLRNIVAVAAIIFGLSISSAKAQSRSTTLDILEKTSYVIDDACDIGDYFYYNNPSLSQAIYYQEYAYKLYDVRRYESAIIYSLRARDYALDAIEDCDDYWEYYDYQNYGYSPVWGNRPNVSVTITIGNFNFGNMRCASFHSVYKNRTRCRLNYDHYFSDYEMRYMRRLPQDRVLLDDFHRHMGNIRFDSYRPKDIPFRSRILADRNNYTRRNANAAQQIQSIRPNDIRPQHAARPTSPETRRVTTTGTRITQEPRRNQDYDRNNNVIGNGARPNTNNIGQGAVPNNNTGRREQGGTVIGTGARPTTSTIGQGAQPNNNTGRREQGGTIIGTGARPNNNSGIGTGAQVNNNSGIGTGASSRRQSTTTTTTNTRTQQRQEAKDTRRRTKDADALQKAATTSTTSNSGIGQGASVRRR